MSRKGDMESTVGRCLERLSVVMEQQQQAINLLTQQQGRQQQLLEQGTEQQRQLAQLIAEMRRDGGANTSLTEQREQQQQATNSLTEQRGQQQQLLEQMQQSGGGARAATDSCSRVHGPLQTACRDSSRITRDYSEARRDYGPIKTQPAEDTERAMMWSNLRGDGMRNGQRSDSSRCHHYNTIGHTARDCQKPRAESDQNGTYDSGGTCSFIDEETETKPRVKMKEDSRGVKLRQPRRIKFKMFRGALSLGGKYVVLCRHNTVAVLVQ